MMTAKQIGQQDHGIGMARSRNPYRNQAASRAAWFAGWDEAEAAAIARGLVAL